MAPGVLRTAVKTPLVPLARMKLAGQVGRSDTPTTSANAVEALASARVKARVVGVASSRTTTVMSELEAASPAQ